MATMTRRSGSEQGFDQLLEYIGDELDFESGFYNDAYMDRRITARMRRTDTDSYRAYHRLLERDDGEREALLDSLSINVTGFFRNPEAWDGLRTVLRKLTDDRRQVNVWSAPSADGREPYSVAMLALDDPGIDADRIDVLGTDINHEILRTARSGVYETSKTTDIAEELEPLSQLDPYIQRDGNTFEVRDRVSELVSFEQHDLIRGESKGPFDLVLCRNLLIYIDSSYKVPIFETIEGSLRDGGYLMIGMTETIPAEMRETFEAADKQHRIYRKR
ncbi:Methylase of chemotaxis methyl-accepting protein [Halapricum desulfuricans]|uniref:protein-glutamate O-methyltransferase n=2 Tax=Halapricum desulfuricans TaxID=2841257 RepID=A0A897NDV3_9EURY|nr:Methylase of chemotaxis methyl-accepting protein [Halapricum desulfuricans]